MSTVAFPLTSVAKHGGDDRVVPRDWLLADLASEYSLLSPFLSTSDLFCVRRTCKTAWATIRHPTIHKQNIVWQACTDRHPALLLWALEAGGRVSSGSAWMVGELGDVTLLRRLHQLHPEHVQYALYGCADMAQEADLQRVLQDGLFRPLVSPAFRSIVARRGFVALAQELEAQPSVWRDECPADVCAGGNLEMVQWVFTGEDTLVSPELVSNAATSGNVALLQWLVDRGAPIHPQAMVEAAHGGHTDAMHWLAVQGVPVGADAVDAAAGGGHMAAVEWLWRRKAPFTPAAAYNAARCGHLDVLRWCLEHAKVEVSDGQVALAAAEDDSCLVLRWWVEQGRQWQPHAVAYAAVHVRVNFTVAHYVRDMSGCLTPAYSDIAAKFGNIDELRYGVQHGVPLSKVGVRVAVDGGQTATLAYALRNGLVSGEDDMHSYIVNAASSAVKEWWASRKSTRE